jgi:hypothetical protein
MRGAVDRGLNILETVAGQIRDHVGARCDDARMHRLRDTGDRGCRCRFGENPRQFTGHAHGFADRIVADRHESAFRSLNG